ncbi:hypothetical protein TGGT1_250670 [Toxoplasma gondii GT1]|uniref:Uncharacterized protein n=1 Tax=Toxoplasma gondii (strain ATCC 50853 / GT1) TaxID=507601 RepID=S7WG62_TOXGG|nr:hypothetical protein TGGT1_250670 [Toxoplasma gondii GT1]
MAFWRLRALFNSVLALHAVAEWLDGFLVPRSYQRESRCRWLALPCALHAAAASDAPPDTPETVPGESSDDGRQRPTASGDAGVPLSASSDAGVPSTGSGDAGVPSTGSGDAGVPLPASSDAGVPSTASGDAGVPSTASGDAGVPSTASGDAGVPSMASGDAGVPLPASGGADVPFPASGGSAVGSDLSLCEKLELTRHRKSRIKRTLAAAKCRWSSADSYVRYRTAQRRCRASRADAPVEPPQYEQERVYRERYKEVERAQMKRIERLRATLASVEQEERELLAAINRQTADATAGDTTEGEPGPSTSMARSQGPAAQILPEVPGVSMEVAASDSSSDDGSIASSPSGKASSAEVAATHSTTAASSGHASRVQAPADKLSLIRARKSSLLVRLGDLKKVWKTEEAYVQSRRRSRNSLRALRGVSRASSCICVWGTHSRPASQKLFR